jgi:hypothetical protein
MYADMRWQNLEKRKDNDVGFVDPNVLYKHPNLPPNYKPTWKNLMNFLVNQRDKKEILFPYNFKWVLLSN